MYLFVLIIIFVTSITCIYHIHFQYNPNINTFYSLSYICQYLTDLIIIFVLFQLLSKKISIIGLIRGDNELRVMLIAFNKALQVTKYTRSLNNFQEMALLSNTSTIFYNFF